MSNEAKVCKICSHEVKDEFKICPSCGAFIPDEEAVEATRILLNKKYGIKDDTLLYRVKSHPFYREKKPMIATGSLKLNKILLGGYPMTHRIELAGPEGAGKTTLALQAAASVQRRGGQVLYIDMEHAIDSEYASRIGVDLDGMIICQPDSGTQAFDIIVNMAPVMKLIILDSIATCAPINTVSKEVKMEKGELKDSNPMAELARMISQFQPKLMNVVGKSNCTYIFINQLREKVSSMPGIPSTIQTCGGRAMRHLAQLRIWLYPEKDLYQDDIYIGKFTNVQIKKAKHMGGYSKTKIKIDSNGIDTLQEIIDLSVEYGIIEKAGAWFKYKNEENDYKWQGEAQFRKELESNEVLYEEIETQINESIARDFAEAKCASNIDIIIEEEDCDE